MSHKTTASVAHTIGIDTGKNTLHLIGLDDKGAIVLREKIARGRIAARFANVPRCLIGIEAGMATHYVARELIALGHDVKQVPPAYAKPFRQGHKNDFRDAHAIAEAVQRPSTRCVPVKTDDQLDLQALHRVRSRLVGQRTAVINQIRGFLLEHGIAVRQGLRFLRQQLPDMAKRSDVLPMIIILLMIWVADGTSGALTSGRLLRWTNAKRRRARISLSGLHRMLRSTPSFAFEPNRMATAVTCDPSSADVARLTTPYLRCRA